MAQPPGKIDQYACAVRWNFRTQKSKN